MCSQFSSIMIFDKLIRQLDIIVIKRIKSKNILFSYNNITIKFSKEENSYIDKEWNIKTKNNPFLFNDKIIHVIQQNVLNSKILFSTCTSNFKEFAITNTNKFKQLFNKAIVIRPISVGTMIITSDNKWIIGKRQNTFDFEDCYTVVAGYLNPVKDIIYSKPDPFFALRREIIEETGIFDKDINNIYCLGLVDSNQPYLAFSTSLNISRDQFQSMIPKEKEFINFEYYNLTRETFEQFLLNNYQTITPHACANMLMYYYLNGSF
jgi:hypothetical protein